MSDIMHRQFEIVVRRRLMPPWKPESRFAEFANAHRLTNRGARTEFISRFRCCHFFSQDGLLLGLVSRTAKRYGI